MIKMSTIIGIILAFIIITAALIFSAFQESTNLKRDPVTLLNRYYLLKKSNPAHAQEALVLLLQEDSNNIPALNELSNLYIKEQKVVDAIPLLEQLYQLEPHNQEHAFKLATLYVEHGDWDQALPLINTLKQQPAYEYKIYAQALVNKMASYIPYYKSNAVSAITLPTSSTERPELVELLLNYYYKLQKEDPLQAESLLQVLSILSPQNEQITLELGYLALQKKHQQQAIKLFLRAYELNPSASSALQLAYLYAGQNKKQQAAHFFLMATDSPDPQIKRSAENGLSIVTQITKPPQRAPLVQSQEQLLFDQFYLLKKHNDTAAWQLIQRIIKLNPHNRNALKEGGYLATKLHHRNQAIVYFSRAYELSYEAEVAMQLGYLYDLPDRPIVISTDKYWAYHYFHLATYTDNKKLELQAQNAMTNLSGLQTKVLPEPFFTELFFDPFTQSRFGLTVRPIVGRLGIEQHNRWQSKTYFVFRRTQDNKSINAGQIPQIYEDNVQILGIGQQITPIASFPLIAFIEGGRAYDLVFRNRNRWRDDLRGGLMYYNEFGARPAYFEHFVALCTYYSTLYGDVTYFSRYNNNVIGNIKTHQGLRLAQYRSSMLNVYVTARIIEDTNRDFFNNIAEIGPGIGFIPSNRYKVEIRFEHINGRYLPVRGSTNPYGKTYTNNIVQLFFYMKL